MKKALFAFVFSLFFGQLCHGQGACFFMGGPQLDFDGCTVFTIQSPPPGATVGLSAGMSLMIGGDFMVTGQMTGDTGAVVSGSTSFPCTHIYGGQGWFNVGALYSPGIHFVNVKFTYCAPPYNGLTAGTGKIVVIVNPVNPATNPPPVCGAVMIDPVKSGLVVNNAVTSDEQGIGGASSPVYVQGASADGVTQVIVAVRTQNLGDSVQINLMNDAGSPSNSTDQDGGLMPIGGSVTNLSNNVPATADVMTPFGPAAFAVYRGPTNFARDAQSFPQDYSTNERFVRLQTICLTSGGQPSNPSNNSVTVFRPPVAFVHGLWSNPNEAWSAFKPPSNSPNQTLWGDSPVGVQNPSYSIEKYTVDYSQQYGVTSTAPQYSPAVNQVSGNALGFSFNAPLALTQLQNAIASFANGHFIAAVQGDVVAHSMGGDIARFMGGLPNFLTQNPYGTSPVHKLITIGTPHQGTPLAGMLLPNGANDPNHCVRAILAHRANNYSFQSVTIGSNTASGAVGDFSAAPNNLPVSVPFPIAYLAGKTDFNINLNGLGDTVGGQAIYWICGGVFDDPVAQALTQGNWDQQIFGGADNDGIVPVTSQLNGFSSTIGSINTLPGVIHSPGIEKLGFNAPTELDPTSGIPDAVVNLLNEPSNGVDFH